MTRTTRRPGPRSVCALVAALVVLALSACGTPSQAAEGTPGESLAATSQNGWPAIGDGYDPRLVPFPWVTGRVLDGDVYAVLSRFAERFDAEVEPIDPDSSWGWADRPVRGYDEVLSNHASGTAVDLNATAHPAGSVGTFTDEQVARLREILDELAPVLAWGGDFEHPDEMHVEIVGTPAEVAQVAARVATG